MQTFQQRLGQKKCKEGRLAEKKKAEKEVAVLTVPGLVNPTPGPGMHTFHTHVSSAVGAEIISGMHTAAPCELI
jgi:hypothetical protein